MSASGARVLTGRVLHAVRTGVGRSGTVSYDTLTAMPRPVRFCLVGASGVVVNTAVLAALHSAAHLPLTPAAAVATEVAIISNFSANNALTFRGERWSARRLLHFNVASLVAGAIAIGVLTLLVGLTGMNYLVADVVAIGVGAGFNYATSVHFVWARIAHLPRRRLRGEDARDSV